MPLLTLIAGPNGSGKSTLTRMLSFEGKERLLDPDAIARRINPSDIGAAALQAGRQVLTLTQEYLSAGLSFAVETTLSGQREIALVTDALARGYDVDLVYVSLDDPERNVLRVQDRVVRGGHMVPETDIRRRYERSLANARRAIPMATRATVYDNSGVGHVKVLQIDRGRIGWRARTTLEWVNRLAADLDLE